MKSSPYVFGVGLFGLACCLVSCADDDHERTIGIRSALIGYPSTIGVVRPNGLGAQRWMLRTSNTQGPPTLDFYFGPSDVNYVISGDWNGDGLTTTGFVYVDGGQWRWVLRNSLGNGYPDFDFYYGSPSAPYQDVPVVGDWDGNGTTTIGVFRRGPDPFNSEGQWLLRDSQGPGNPELCFIFGKAIADPVTGDWDGNGTTTIGVTYYAGPPYYRRWELRDSNNTGPTHFTLNWGAYPETGLDTPVTGDWDGNGTTTVGIFHEEFTQSARWLLRDSNAPGGPLWDWNISYGNIDFADRPVVGVWD